MKKILSSNTSISNVQIEFMLKIKDKKVEVSFVVIGDLSKYIFPKKSEIKRADELWKATSFELFLADSKKEEYYELNFSPSSSWNFYYLNSYRADVKEVKGFSRPKIECVSSANTFKIVCELVVKNLEEFDICNVTCVLLNKNNERTFWSVNHLLEVADFHERKNFFKIT